MNILIIKTSERRLIAEEILEGLGKTTEVNNAFSECCNFLDGEVVESITIIFNGEVSEYTVNDGIQNFLKTI